MQFPVWIHIGSLRVHPHPVLEALGYFLGYRLYRFLRKREGDPLGEMPRLTTLAAAVGGAAIGSKVLAWCEDPHLTLQHWHDLGFLLSGKTIVGGLLGGLLAVELVKLRLGIRQATGDLYALPLLVGTAIGRIGCFLTGPDDETWGVATPLPWGIDPGNGVRYHPAPLYEILFLALLAAFMVIRRRQPHQQGDQFKLFMTGYLLWRLVVEFIKTDPVIFLGLNSIQFACIAGLLWYLPHIPRLLGLRKDVAFGG